MQRSTLAQFSIATLVGVMIVAGLFTIGGPETGRMEKRDDLRHTNLRTLERQVRCIADSQDNILPETITATQNCAGSKTPVDPVTDAPYVYEKIGPKFFHLCASFEVPEWLPSYFNPSETGELSCRSILYSKGK